MHNYINKNILKLDQGHTEKDIYILVMMYELDMELKLCQELELMMELLLEQVV